MKLLFIDTETGGLDPQQHSLLEVAFGVWDDGVIIDTLNLPIYHEVYNVTQQAMSINKIDLRKNDGGWTPAGAVTQIQSFIGQHFLDDEERPALVGQNVGFDVGFLKTLFRPGDYEYTFSHRTIDTASIIRFLQMSGVVQPFGTGLDDAIRYLGIPVEEGARHTALGDVRATAAVFNVLKRIVGGGI